MNSHPSVTPAVPAYRNPALPAEKRAKDLLARMTLAEKAAQMVCVWQQKADKLVDARGNFDFPKARAAFKKNPGLAAPISANKPRHQTIRY